MRQRPSCWMCGGFLAEDEIMRGRHPELADCVLRLARRVESLEAGLPGTGVAEAPENAPSREDGAAPVPDPAHICAVDDEC